MAAYSELQQEEFTKEKDGYTGEQLCGSDWGPKGWTAVVVHGRRLPVTRHLSPAGQPRTTPC